MKKVSIWLLFLLAAVAANATTITNLAVTAQSGTTATMQWTTDVAANSQVFYGIGNTSGGSPINSTLVTGHTITITGLIPGSTYNYRAFSIDGFGNQATSATQVFTICDPTALHPGLTNTNGTINNYYEYGLYTFNWVNTSTYSVSPTICGVALPTPQSGFLDGGASFNTQIPDSNQIVPSPSQWSLTATGIDGSIGSITVQQAITPNGNNLSSLLKSAAVGQLIHVWYDPQTGIFYPPLPGGGGGFPTGVTNQLLYYAVNGNVVTPLTLGTNLSILSGVLNATGGGTTTTITGPATSIVASTGTGNGVGTANATVSSAGVISAANYAMGPLTTLALVGVGDSRVAGSSMIASAAGTSGLPNAGPLGNQDIISRLAQQPQYLNRAAYVANLARGGSTCATMTSDYTTLNVARWAPGGSSAPLATRTDLYIGDGENDAYSATGSTLAQFQNCISSYLQVATAAGFSPVLLTSYITAADPIEINDVVQQYNAWFITLDGKPMNGKIIRTIDLDAALPANNGQTAYYTGNPANGVNTVYPFTAYQITNSGGVSTITFTTPQSTTNTGFLSFCTALELGTFSTTGSQYLNYQKATYLSGAGTNTIVLTLAQPWPSTGVITDAGTAWAWNPLTINVPAGKHPAPDGMDFLAKYINSQLSISYLGTLSSKSNFLDLFNPTSGQIDINGGVCISGTPNLAWNLLCGGNAGLVAPGSLVLGSNWENLTPTASGFYNGSALMQFGGKDSYFSVSGTGATLGLPTYTGTSGAVGGFNVTAGGSANSVVGDTVCATGGGSGTACGVVLAVTSTTGCTISPGCTGVITQVTPPTNGQAGSGYSLLIYTATNTSRSGVSGIMMGTLPSVDVPFKMAVPGVVVAGGSLKAAAYGVGAPLADRTGELGSVTGGTVSTATVSAGASVTGCYVTGDTVSSNFGFSATVTATSCTVTALTVVNGGYGFTASPNPIATAGGSGTGLTFTVTTVNYSGVGGTGRIRFGQIYLINEFGAGVNWQASGQVSLNAGITAYGVVNTAGLTDTGGNFSMQILNSPVPQPFGTSNLNGPWPDNTTFCFRVAGVSGNGGLTLANAETCGTTGSTGTNTNTAVYNWRVGSGAVGYKVYCRASGIEQLCATITDPNAVSWQDYGTVTPSGALPSSNTTAGTFANTVWAAGSGHTCLHADTTGTVTATGTDCSTGVIPTGTTNQLLYYAAGGTTLTPLTLGTNLSIGSGVLNAASTAATAFSALTGSTNSSAAMVVGSGASMAASGTGMIAATSVPGSGVTGTLPYTALAALSANQVLGALTATTPSGLTVPSCSTATSALIWTSGAGFGCNAATSGLSGMTAGYLPLAATAATITGNSHLDDGITTASVVTSSETLAAPIFKSTGTGPGFYQPNATTVATLNSTYPCNSGRLNAETVVSDAVSPTYLGALTGGGAVNTPVFCNGTAWVSY